MILILIIMFMISFISTILYISIKHRRKMKSYNKFIEKYRDEPEKLFLLYGIHEDKFYKK